MWKITVHPSAVRDFNWLRDNAPRALDNSLKKLEELAKLQDPRTGCHVREILYDAPGWYRLAVYEERTRIVFRLLQQVEGKIVEVNGEIHPNCKSALQICRIGFRTPNTYGSALKSRHEKVRNWR